MKLFQIIVLCVFMAICKVNGKPRHNALERLRPNTQIKPDGTEKPVEIKPIIMLPRNKLKFVETETVKPQPLESLYKLYVGRKPVMRKFVPTPKVITEQIAITRRPLMKQHKFVAVSSSPRPQPNKENLFSNGRRKLSNLINNRKNSTVPKEAANNGDDYDKFESGDMMVSGSKKVYKKIMGALPIKFKTKPNTVAPKEYTLKNAVSKGATNDSFVAQDDVQNKTSGNVEVNNTSPKLQEKADLTDEKENIPIDKASEDADKSEFIFIPANPVVIPNVEGNDTP